MIKQELLDAALKGTQSELQAVIKKFSKKDQSEKDGLKMMLSEDASLKQALIDTIEDSFMNQSLQAFAEKVLYLSNLGLDMHDKRIETLINKHAGRLHQSIQGLLIEQGFTITQEAEHVIPIKKVTEADLDVQDNSSDTEDDEVGKDFVLVEAEKEDNGFISKMMKYFMDFIYQRRLPKLPKQKMKDMSVSYDDLDKDPDNVPPVEIYTDPFTQEENPSQDQDKQNRK